jgi:pimeloyl-ACP methyl ester carboxylesterase
MLRHDERYSDEDDDYLDQETEKITESPGLFSNNNHRFEDENHLAFSDIYSDDSDDEYDHDGGSFLPQGLFGRRTSATETAANRDNNAADPLLQTPVVYRYYSRNRARDVADGSIPFIFLGPNVDHWKVAGKELAARGFSVMAVERVKDEPGDDEHGDYSSPGYDANLILGLLEALKWHRVVLVACDSESALAIRAAMELAPGRVVGLVLCGNLKAADDFVANMYPQNRRLPGSFAVDRFLHSNLRCPFQIVWDGDVPARSYFSGSGLDAAASEPLQKDHRNLVLGGGSAPHRRRPEHFAWVLTRFVEEKIAPTQVSRFKVPRARARGGQQTLGQQRQKPSQVPQNSLLLSLSEFVSPGSLVVWGRVVASALFYSTAVKIALFQYEKVRFSFITINTAIEMVSRLRLQILGAVPSFLGSLGSLSFPSRARIKSRVDTEVEPEVAEPSRPSEAEEGEEVKPLLVPPPISEDEEEQPSATSAASDDEEEEQSSAPPSPSSDDDDDDENQEESSDTEDVEKEEGPVKAPDFKPSFFLDHVIV